MSQSKNKLIFTVLFFVTGLLIGSFFNSQSAHAFTVNNQNSISFTSTSYCDADWTLDEVFSFQYSPSLGSYGNSSSGTPQSFDIWTTHIRPNIKKHKYLIYSTKDGKVNVFVNYNHHDQYKIKVNKNGIAYLVDNKNSTIRYDHPKVFSASNHSKWQAYDLMFFTLYPSPKSKSCVDYPILKNIGLSAYFSSAADIRQDYEVFKSNFQVEYEDGYEGPLIPSALEDTLIKKQAGYTYSINKGSIRINFTKPEDYPDSLWRQMLVAKYSDTSVQCDNGTIFNMPEFTGEDYINTGVSYSLPPSCKVSSPQLLRFNFYFQNYDLKKYIFDMIEIAIPDFTSDSSTSYNSTFLSCSLVDIPCHFNNFFKSLLDFVKWLFIPSQDFLKSSITEFSVQNLGNSLFSFSDVFVSVKEVFLTIFNSVFNHQIGYSKPCYIFPKVVIFGHLTQFNICAFEFLIGESNFNALKTFNSLVLMFAGIFVVRGLVVKIGLMFLGGGFTE